MAKVFVVFSALLAITLAEPPVNSYLPPGRSAQPSRQYGAPDASGSFGNGFGSRALSSTYGAPSNALESFGRNAQAPSSRYGAPGNGFGQPSSTYGAPGNGFGQPSSTYGVPEQSHNNVDFDSVSIEAAARFGSFNGARQPSSTYGAPSARFGAPSQSYGAPAQSASSRFGQSSSGFGASSRTGQLSSVYGAPSFQSNGAAGRSFGASSSQGVSRFTAAIPSNTYGAPSNGFSGGFRSSQSSFSAPSSTYGAPANGFNGGFNGGFRSAQSSFSALSSSYGAPSNNIDSAFGRQPSSEYGVPGYARRGTTEDPLAEPANYQYNYEVRDEEQGTGAEFGHQESREDESARGVYHVLLPDGRMQIVEYEADEEGYRPNIRYEETGAYPAARNGQNGHGGY